MVEKRSVTMEPRGAAGAQDGISVRGGFFEPQGTTMGRALRRTHAVYDMAYTVMDFAAAIMFVLGSIFFFYASLTFAGTWLFLVGSVFFAVKPTIRLAREIHVLRQAMAEERELAARG